MRASSVSQAHDFIFISGKVRPIPLRLVFAGLFRWRGRPDGDLQLSNDALHHFRRREQIPRERRFAGIAERATKSSHASAVVRKPRSRRWIRSRPVKMAQKFGAEDGQSSRGVALAKHIGISPSARRAPAIPGCQTERSAQPRRRPLAASIDRPASSRKAIESSTRRRHARARGDQFRGEASVVVIQR